MAKQPSQKENNASEATNRENQTTDDAQNAPEFNDTTSSTGEKDGINEDILSDIPKGPVSDEIINEPITPASIDDLQKEVVEKTAMEAEAAEKEKREAFTTEKKQIAILANSIDKCFADREKTNLPKLTQQDVILHAGRAAKSINIVFNYTNDDKTTGFITLEEFNDTLRCPINGYFIFNEIGK